MKKTFLIMACLLAGGLSAPAAYEPPAKYNHPYNGKLTIYHLDTWQVRKICGNPLAAACAVHTKGGCTIYQADLRYHNWITEATLRHEIAHCNGWPGDHPYN